MLFGTKFRHHHLYALLYHSSSSMALVRFNAAIFEMTGRAKHKTFSAAMQVLNCEKLPTTLTTPTSMVNDGGGVGGQSHHSSSYDCRTMSQKMALLLCVFKLRNMVSVMFNFYLFLLCHPSAK